ncbi:hypothetical protein C2845_PM02G16200 [Panicum miliaceum]|uniref:Uncharacterized protein n=1 Tax=Panicum miliaceum TaxID=4540 RepID=A0A3L6S4E5_PANMI|nr:hypothetical protein C2845_PM02G16200 [Panicum miliaceum]
MGLKQDMKRAFAYAGWENFIDIIETGSHLPTMEFLMSLGIEDMITQLSEALGFHKTCLLDPNALIKDHQYDRSTWWNSISDEPVSSKNSIVSIHNPTLRLLAKWLSMVVHPRSDLRLYSSPELQCLLAMAHKIRFSPAVMSMLAHWQKMIASKNPIDMTSLVTRIVAHVGALENAQLTYLPSTEAFQFKIGREHFVQGHLMRGVV